MGTICPKTLVALRWPVEVEFQTKLELLGEKKKDYLKKSFVLINHSWITGERISDDSRVHCISY